MRTACWRAVPEAGGRDGVAMLVKTPRWLLILEAVLLLGALLLLGYKALMWIGPLGNLDQTPHARKIDPQTQILQYYRQYPERYLVVVKDTWQYADATRTAYHNFTIKNSATVAYQGIEVRFEYQSSSKKVLYTQVVKLPGTIAALGLRKIENMPVKNVPAAATIAVLSVAVAQVY
jgi:hypothetical protein